MSIRRLRQSNIASKKLTSAIRTSSAVVISYNTSPGVSAYEWTEGTGFGAKYADPTWPAGMATPANGGGVFYFNDNFALGMSSGTAPTILPFSNSTGWGTAWTPPSSSGDLGNSSTGIDMNIDQDVIVSAGFATGEAVTAWQITTTSYGTKYAQPTSFFSSNYTRAVAIMPDSSAVLLGLNSSPNVGAYTFSKASGFGTKYSNPSTLPTAGAYAIALNHAGTQVFVGQAGASPYVTAYPWSSSTGFGTKYANPSSPIQTSYSIRDLKFNSTDTVLLMAMETSGDFLAAYTIDSNGFGTKYADPVGATALDDKNGCAWSRNNLSVIGVGRNVVSGSNRIDAYAWSNSTGFGTRYTNPSTALPATGFSASFN